MIVTSGKVDKHKAFSRVYMKTFQIDSSGKKILHEKGNAHKKNCPTNQRTLIYNNPLNSGSNSTHLIQD